MALNPFTARDVAADVVTPADGGDFGLSGSMIPAHTDAYADQHSFHDMGDGRGQSLRLRESLEGQRRRLLERLRSLPPSRAVRVFPVIRSGQVALLTTLLQNAIVSADETDYNGCTPLHVAAHMGSDEMVMVLLSYGANVTACDHLGRTPTDLAHKNNHSYVVKILTQVARRRAGPGVAAEAPATLNNTSLNMANASIRSAADGSTPPPTPVGPGKAQGEYVGRPSDGRPPSQHLTQPSPAFAPAASPSHLGVPRGSGENERRGSSAEESPACSIPDRSPGAATATPGGVNACSAGSGHGMDTTPGFSADRFLEGSYAGNVRASPHACSSSAGTPAASMRHMRSSSHEYQQPMPGFGASHYGAVSLGPSALTKHADPTIASSLTVESGSVPLNVSAPDPGTTDGRSISPACMMPPGTEPPRSNSPTAAAAATADQPSASNATAGLSQAPTTSPKPPERLASVFTSLSDSVSVVICMVGLPGRGKSFISKHVSRFLNWKGIPCRVFNAGDYRRNLLGADGTSDADFYDPHNKRAAELREQMAELACADAAGFIGQSTVAVAVLDATNTTRERRKKLVEYFGSQPATANSRLLFIESVCTRQDVIRENILRAKFGNKDFANVTNPNEVIDSFNARIEQYKKVYQTLDEALEPELSYIRILNVKETVQLHNVSGIIPTRVANFLINLHPVAFPIYICRHGETVGDTQGVFGGDDDLTAEGKRFASALADFVQARADSSGSTFTVMFAQSSHPTRETVRPLLDKIAAEELEGSSLNIVRERHCLREVHYGNFTNLSREEALRQYPRMYQRLFGATKQKDSSLSARQRPLIAPPPLEHAREKAGTILDSELSEVRTYITPGPATSLDTNPYSASVAGPAAAMLSATAASTSVASPAIPQIHPGGRATFPANVSTTATPTVAGMSISATPAGGGSNWSSSQAPPQLVAHGPGHHVVSPAPMASPLVMPGGMNSSSSPPILPVGLLAGEPALEAHDGGGGGALTGISPVEPRSPAVPPGVSNANDTPTSVAGNDGRLQQQAPTIQHEAPAPRMVSLAEAALAPRHSVVGACFDSHKYPAYNIGYPRGESTRLVVVRLEDVIMSAARCDGPLLIVCPDTPARGLLAYLCDLAPEQTQYVRLPHQTVVEIGTKGDVRLASLEPLGSATACPSASTVSGVVSPTTCTT